MKAQQKSCRLIINTIKIITFGYPLAFIAQERKITVPIESRRTICGRSEKHGRLHIIISLICRPIEVERNFLIVIEQIFSRNTFGKDKLHKSIPIIDFYVQHFVVGIEGIGYNLGRRSRRTINIDHCKRISHIVIFEIAQNNFTCISGRYRST